VFHDGVGQRKAEANDSMHLQLSACRNFDEEALLAERIHAKIEIVIRKKLNGSNDGLDCISLRGREQDRRRGKDGTALGY